MPQHLIPVIFPRQINLSKEFHHSPHPPPQEYWPCGEEEEEEALGGQVLRVSCEAGFEQADSFAAAQLTCG